MPGSMRGPAGAGGTTESVKDGKTSALVAVPAGFRAGSWAESLKRKKPGERVKAKDGMPLWLMTPRYMALIEDGVGKVSAQLKSTTAKGSD